MESLAKSLEERADRIPLEETAKERAANERAEKSSDVAEAIEKESGEERSSAAVEKVTRRPSGRRASMPMSPSFRGRARTEKADDDGGGVAEGGKSGEEGKSEEGMGAKSPPRPQRSPSILQVFLGGDNSQEGEAGEDDAQT